MREVIPKQLWLGNALDVRNPPELHELGVVAVVDLALEEPPSQLSREMTYCRFPLLDGAGNATTLLSAAIATTALFIHKRIPTLVGCSGGMSRSPSIIAAALAFVQDDDPADCLQQVIAGSPHDVSPLLWEAIKNALLEMAA